MPEIPGDWVAMARLIGLLFVGYFMVIWFTSVVWVYRDISARTNDPISQLIAVLVAVVFPIVGLPVYFVLRPSETLQEAYDRQLEQEAILSELHSISACPDCRRPISEDFMVCAYCGTQLKQPCVSCNQLMQFAWRHCPYCAAPQPRRQPPQRQNAQGAEQGRGGSEQQRQRRQQQQPAGGGGGGGADAPRGDRAATAPAGGRSDANTTPPAEPAPQQQQQRRRAATAEAPADEAATTSGVATARPRRPRTEDGPST